jgi:uroporphyrin-3 C-methyltransferase
MADNHTNDINNPPGDGAQPIQTPAEPAPPRQGVQSHKGGGKGIAVAALLLALLAAGGVGYLGYLWDADRKIRLAESADLDTRVENALTQVVEERNADLTALQNQAKKLNDLAETLQTQNQAQDEQGQSLRTSVNKVQYAIKQVQGDIATLKGEVEIYKGSMEIQKADIQNLLTDVNGLQKSLQGLRTAQQDLNKELNTQAENDQIRKSAVQALQKEANMLEGNLQSLTEQLQENRQERTKAMADLDNRIENLQLVQRNLLTNIDNVKTIAAQGGDINALVLSEIEYLLRMAQHKLNLQRDVAGSIEALTAANERLQAIDENSFQSVQQMVQENIATLRGLELPDRSALAHRIVEMEERLAELPLRIDSQLADLKEKVKPKLGDSGSSEETGDPWWRRASTAAMSQLKDIVVIRRERSDELPLLTPDEEYFLFQNLRMELEAMRVALLSNDVDSYLESDAMARKWVRTYFDTDNEKVAAFIDDLEQLKDIKLNPYLPDISNTLQAFQEVMENRTPLRSLSGSVAPNNNQGG